MLHQYQIIVGLLLLGSVLHIAQFQLRRKHREDGSSNARVQVLVKAIMALLVWKNYEWAYHFAILFSITDLVSVGKDLLEKHRSKHIEWLVGAIDLAILILAIMELID